MFTQESEIVLVRTRFMRVTMSLMGVKSITTLSQSFGACINPFIMGNVGVQGGHIKCADDGCAWDLVLDAWNSVEEIRSVMNI